MKGKLTIPVSTTPILKQATASIRVSVEEAIEVVIHGLASIHSEDQEVNRKIRCLSRILISTLENAQDINPPFGVSMTKIPYIFPEAL